MTIKAIIFDYAGVIGDDGYWVWLRKNVKNIEEESEYFHEISALVDSADISEEEFVRRIAVKSGFPGEQIRKEVLDLLVVYPEVKSLLAELKPKFKVGLLSNFIFEWLDPILHKNELYQYFDVPIISTSVRLKKPDPEIYKLALRELGVRAEESIFIDDRQINLEAAKSLGMKTLLCSSPKTLRGQLLELISLT